MDDATATQTQVVCARELRQAFSELGKVGLRRRCGALAETEQPASEGDPGERK